jgi:hypothetical protein
MSCTIPVLTIDKQDCVGDSLGKHNYNAMALDAGVCNLSSLIYKNDTNLSTIFQELSSIVNSYQILERKYDESKLYHILTSSTTVNLLSSFWGNYEFSVQYPFNALNLPNESLTVIVPTLSTVNLQNVDTVVQNRLQILANSFLSQNYPAIKYQTNTVINVIFFLYNLVPNITNATTNDPITVVKTTNSAGSATNTFTYNDRLLYSKYSRDNVYLTTGVILKYYVQENRWNYNGYLIDNNIKNAPVTPLVPAIVPPTNTTTVTQSDVNTIVECSPLKNNTYYTVLNYTSSRAFCSGTSKKKAKIILTFRGTDKKVITFEYQANGYNAAAQSGGTDVWIEFNSSDNTIKAYEEHPSAKKLMKTWNYPWSDKIGVNFKYSIGNGIELSCCGVARIGV